MKELQDSLNSTNSINEGWSIHVYDRHRRLMLTLEPTHGWIFLLGCGLGMLLAVVWVNIARYAPAAEPVSATENPQLQLD